MVQNTELFDAVFHIVLNLMADENSLKSTFLKLASKDLRHFVNSCFKNGAVQTTYLARTKVLQTLKNVETVSNMKVLDCAAITIEDIIGKIISPIWPSSIRSEFCECHENETKIGFLDIGIDLGKMKNVFAFNESYQNCDSCSKQKIVFEKAGDVVFIKMKKNQSTCFDRIPQVICIQNDIFTLNALLIQTFSVDDMPHFVSHVKRGKSWYLFDNNINERKSNLKSKNIFPILIVYIRPTFEQKKDLLIGTPNDINLLQNFHTFNVDGTDFELIDVCGPDSLFHSLVCIFHDNPHLLNCAKGNNTMKQLFTAYMKKDMDTVYACRIKLLKTVFKSNQVDNIEKINCKSNVYIVLKDIFMNTFPSSILKCNCGFHIYNAVIDLNYDYLIENGIRNLQYSFYETKRSCGECKSKMTNAEFSNIIFVDIQPTNNRSIIEAISDFPVEIILRENQYRLQSIVNFSSLGSEKHYTVYCLRRDNSWYHLDDMRETVSIAQRSTIVSPHMLVYIRTS